MTIKKQWIYILLIISLITNVYFLSSVVFKQNQEHQINTEKLLNDYRKDLHYKLKESSDYSAQYQVGYSKHDYYKGMSKGFVDSLLESDKVVSGDIDLSEFIGNIHIKIDEINSMTFSNYSSGKIAGYNHSIRILDYLIGKKKYKVFGN